eukprot:3448124-Pyramimonas_sp.AAC.1
MAPQLQPRRGSAMPSARGHRHPIHHRNAGAVRRSTACGPSKGIKSNSRMWSKPFWVRGPHRRSAVQRSTD